MRFTFGHIFHRDRSTIAVYIEPISINCHFVTHCKFTHFSFIWAVGNKAGIIITKHLVRNILFKFGYFKFDIGCNTPLFALLHLQEHIVTLFGIGKECVIATASMVKQHKLVVVTQLIHLHNFLHAAKLIRFCTTIPLVASHKRSLVFGNDS